MNYGRCVVVYDGSPCAGSSKHKPLGYKPCKLYASGAADWALDLIYFWDVEYPGSNAGVIHKVRLWYCGKCHAEISFMKLLRDLKEGKLE